MHWNGKSWRVIKNLSAPPPAHDGGLTAVAALSRTSVWAAGDYSSGSAEHVFIEHWNGKSWHRQADRASTRGSTSTTGVARAARGRR